VEPLDIGLDKTDQERTVQELGDLDRLKSELIQVLSHELLTPVTVIQGSIETLSSLEGRMSPEDLQGLVDSVTRATTRIQRLVRDLDAVASLDREEVRLRARPVTVNELIMTAIQEFPVRAHRIRLPDPAADPVRIWGDPQLAPRALSAVLENALDASEDETQIDVDVAAATDHAEVRIIDRGHGIAEEQRVRIFEPFTQADSSFTRPKEGVGIGLYLARKIMDAHGGRISVEDADGGGTIFVLTFPAAPGST
jgi:two-component system, OmpR family, sensor histidine kinase KdpD